MPQASNEYKATYSKENFARIEFVIPKQAKPVLVAMAKAAGESVSEYVQGAILRRMGVDQWPLQEEVSDDMKVTEVRKYIRQELKCPADFLDHLSRWGELERLRGPLADRDWTTVNDIMKDMKRTYKDYCDQHEIDWAADNRRTLHHGVRSTL